jgi:alpha-tubulin suppressor-like RCC1 family protein
MAVALVACGRVPTENAPTPTFAVSAGNAGTCAIDLGRVAYCWGLSASGAAYGSSPTRVSGTVRFASLAAGDNFVCGLDVAGAAYCWGANASGQLGNGSTASASGPTAVSGGLVFTAIAAGGAHACALTADGTAYCWGDNTNGQLGTGTSTRNLIPVRVAGGIAFMVISAGQQHTCGISAPQRSGFCWGNNTNGQIGDQSTVARLIPTRVAGASQFATMSAGVSHTCGVSVTGSALCWGSNGGGQLGIGFRRRHARSRRNRVATQFHLGLRGRGAFLRHDDRRHRVLLGRELLRPARHRWSRGKFDAGRRQRPPQHRRDRRRAISLQRRGAQRGTSGHTCAVTIINELYCWGDNIVGQLGTGQSTFNASFAPVKISVAP